MLFDPNSQLRSPVHRKIYRAARPLIERTLRLREFRVSYHAAQQAYAKDARAPSLGAWCEVLLTTLGVASEARVPDNIEIPAKGPLIVVCNHPFGLLDAYLVARVVAQHRVDVRLLASSYLAEMPEINPWLLPYDSWGRGVNPYQNQISLKKARQHLDAGGVLIVFPAEEIAHWKPGRGISEAPWGDHVAHLARQSQASVLPVFLTGRNSTLFHTAGVLNRRLRQSLVAREFCNNRQRLTEMRFGRVLTPVKLKRFTSDSKLTHYLRLHTLLLGTRGKAEAEAGAPPAAPPAPLALGQEIVGLLVAEVARVKQQGGQLVNSGSLTALVAAAAEIPNLLQEIGRQREIAFRLVGEGTGKEIDLDRFDDYYLHLFLWDEDARCLVGAYRIGKADEILAQHGRKGLYTSTLFKFRQPFLDHLADAVEMGRSFIVPAYQRTAATLPLLWKGITLWMAKNPRYRKLFGPVSISDDYHNLSRSMLVEFLKVNALDDELGSHVTPRQPFKQAADPEWMRDFISAKLNHLEDCSALISSLEEDQKGIPVLLKHYLRLNGTLISFNVDKDFGSVVDGLIVVDLVRTDLKLLNKYMGEERCRAYLAHHGIHVDDPAEQ